MKIDVIAIHINSSDPDIEGCYDRNDMEEQCEYLGQPKENWMSHLLGHVFMDYNEWTQELEDMFIKTDSLKKMTVQLGDVKVDIEKVYA